MKKITIYYFHSHIPGMKYKHGEEKNYTGRSLLSIIRYVTGKDCSVMIRPHDGGVNISIDNGGFKQK